MLQIAFSPFSVVLQLGQPRGAASSRSSERSQQRRAPRKLLVTRAANFPIEEWDIVAYDSPAGVSLGRVSKVEAAALQVEPLEEDRSNQVWLVSHEGEQLVPLSAVRRTVPADYLQLVDPDRVSNPHGEHAIEAYRLLEPAWQAAEAMSGSGAGEQ